MLQTKHFLPLLFLLGMPVLPGHPLLAADGSSDLIGIELDSLERDRETLERYFEETAQKRHETIAKYYEEEEKKNQTKTQELKRLLEHYEGKSYLYGKKAQDLQAHTDALLRKHIELARKDAAEAASHRQLALKLREKIASPAQIPKVSVTEKPRHP